MSDEAKSCTLCGLDVGLRPFVLEVGGTQYLFCCEGCRGIYEMLHDIQAPPAGGAVDINPSGKE